MKTIYLILALGFLASCQSHTNTPNGQQNKPVSEPVSDKAFAVQLGNDLTGRGIEGAYTVYSDSTEQHFGHNANTIKSLASKDFATIMTSIIPEKCLGKRVEYTAWVKAKDVKGWAGLWLRIDSEDPYKSSSLGFDNMERRPIKGTQDWAEYHVVLDVPEGAANLVYGALLAGDGQIWLDSMQIKIVDKSVPRTDTVAQKTL